MIEKWLRGGWSVEVTQAIQLSNKHLSQMKPYEKHTLIKSRAFVDVYILRWNKIIHWIFIASFRLVIDLIKLEYSYREIRFVCHDGRFSSLHQYHKNSGKNVEKKRKKKNSALSILLPRFPWNSPVYSRKYYRIIIFAHLRSVLYAKYGN